jgi:hypothetical protein
MMENAAPSVHTDKHHTAPETTLLNVSALPPERTGKAIGGMSHDLFQRGAIFELDGVRRRPHMTLFMARFPTTAVIGARQALAGLTRSLKGTFARHSGYFLTKGNYYEVSYQRTDDLMALHYAVMEALSPLRFSPGSPVIEDYFTPYNAEQEKNARKWGYDLAGDLYRPHITITRFDAHPGLELPHPRCDLSFPIKRIGIFEADGLGATSRMLDRFALDTP